MKLKDLLKLHKITAGETPLLRGYIMPLSFSELLRETEQLRKDLAKAKKIIKNLMEFAEMDDREYEPEYKEAEAFMSEDKNDNGNS